MNEVEKLLGEKDFLDSLYGFAYKRTNNSYEAEDFCSDIILAVLSAANRNSDITSAYAFVWAIAHRVYADYSEKRRLSAKVQVSYEYFEEALNVCCDPTEEYIETENDKLQLRRIMREICFLSKIYRDVCVMYYLDEMKTADIAKKLEITENAVKQRLHSARETIKKGVKKMDTANLTLKPINIVYWGNGKPVGNDPSTVAYRSFSKNLLYLCKDTERTIKELSERLGVPMPFVEEEVEILLYGQNDRYGMLRKTEKGKYISNFIIVDCADFMEVAEMHKKNTDLIAKKFDAYLKANKQKILDMPFLNKQTDTQLIAWPLMARIVWDYEDRVAKKIGKKYFSDITPTKRDFFIFGTAYKDDEHYDMGFYGCDSIYANDIGGYAQIYMSNMYGRRLQKHFECGHNISLDACLRLTIKAIGGIPFSTLSEDERETAAKAIELGYVKKENETLLPKILVSESDGIYRDIVDDFAGELDGLLEPVADEMHGFIKKYVPEHLMGEYKLFVQMTSNGLLDGIIEKCIELGTIVPPKKTPCAEGVIMVVKK